MQEREVLWLAINKTDEEYKQNMGVINHYQAKLEHMKRMINKCKLQIDKSKKENISLQRELNGVLLSKLANEFI